MTIRNATYTAQVTVTGGRAGHASSDDGALDVDLRRPGSSERGTNPEQLFAAAWAACFQSALISAGRQRGIDTSKSSIEAAVALVNNEGVYTLGAEFRIAIPGVDKTTIEELAATAHQICPYSNATRGNVHIEFIGVE